MAERHCGGSVYVCAIRVAALEADGVPLPGASNLYTTTGLTKLTATPEFYQSPEISVPNGCGELCISYMPLPVLKRWTLALELCQLLPELEHLLMGGELFTQASYSVGASSPEVMVFSAANGVSCELWSKHIVNGDIDDVYPYIHWVWPRTRWYPGVVTFDQNAMPRLFTGFSSQNPNWFDGPTDDWQFASDRSYAWAFTSTLPTPACGATPLAVS